MAVTRLRRRAANFTIISGELYKRAFTGSYLKCLPPSEADYALLKVHSGVWQASAKVITDNGTQFIGKIFTSFCKDFHIQLVHTAVTHPQTNGQTKVTNRIILKGMKTRLGKAGGQWAEKIPNVLWAYRTKARTPTGETLFNLCFSKEAVIPVDIGVSSNRVQNFDFNNNEEKFKTNLDLLPEARDETSLKVDAYHQRITRHYNRRVKPQTIFVGVLVLRSIEAAGKGPQRNKLSPL
ncbi:uncharacterized protein LOC110109363 [Dendrobium catenatum]|uniref:uncharacterized protein LOC110109363 n=1 Tax=Dendrobium catenatum TaxID=906689 RepID=UPI0009F61482|nr:uncharacterized protein LOC110109363 [Dendrobium catenatum]